VNANTKQHKLDKYWANQDDCRSTINTRNWKSIRVWL